MAVESDCDILSGGSTGAGSQRGRLMNWAFVDYENHGSLEEVPFSDYQRVFVFCGPKNRNLKFGDIPSNGFCRLEVIRTSTTQRNNLDFHLAFYLGRLHESSSEDVAFHVYTDDGGFDGLISHLHMIGRKCKKLKKSKPNAPETSTTPLSDPAAQVPDRIRHLQQDKRPRNRKRLLNWIECQCGSLSASPEGVYRELVENRLMQESESGVVYLFGDQSKKAHRSRSSHV